ncbi:MAG: Tfp pilus assembly protein PilZ [Alcanivorax sp.]|jgi:Tfp pilus assembly protein PilZ
MTDEHRKYLRLSLENTVFLELRSSGSGLGERAELSRCITLDISREGLRLQLDQAVTIGAILQIGVELSADKGTLYLAGEVKWCLPVSSSDNSWTAGFELLNGSDTDIDQWYGLVAELED